MKKLGLLFICTTLIIALGCKEEETVTAPPETLSPALGLYSITGDGQVSLGWYTSNYEEKFNGYLIYQYYGEYSGEASVDSIPAGFEIVDTVEISGDPPVTVSRTIDGLDNGDTYSFLVVAAMDDWGTISYTSNIIHDTPRHEVKSFVLSKPDSCAIKFSNTDPYFSKTYREDPTASIKWESFDAGTGWRSGFCACDTLNQIQCLGFMSDWDFADEAPSTQEEDYPYWRFSTAALENYVYAIRVQVGTEIHYGKIYVENITGDPADASDVATLWVAYQPDPNNPEYK